LEKASKFQIATTGDLSKLEFFRTRITDDPLPGYREGDKIVEKANLAEQCVAFISSHVELMGEVGSAEIETMCLEKWTKGTYNRARILLKQQGFRPVRKGDAWFIRSPKPEQKTALDSAFSVGEGAEN